MSAARQFRQKLGAELAEELGSDFRYLRSKLTLRRERGGGWDEVALGGPSRNAPLIAVNFDFSRGFHQVAEMERRFGVEARSAHVCGTSLNAHRMKGLNYPVAAEWRVDLRRPQTALVKSILAGLESVAFPFLERFTTLASARDALAKNDSWVCGRHNDWVGLLMMDAALRDWEHFRSWSARHLRTPEEGRETAALLAQCEAVMGAADRG